MRWTTVRHEFVHFIPGELEDETLYISTAFATAVHRCACGCGGKVVTPLSPTDWELTFDGRTVSLHPSIGNWSFPCKSHYWIKQNRVRWDEPWSQAEINAVRAQQRAAKEKYFAPTEELNPEPVRGPWGRLAAWWSRRLHPHRDSIKRSDRAAEKAEK